MLSIWEGSTSKPQIRRIPGVIVQGRCRTCCPSTVRGSSAWRSKG